MLKTSLLRSIILCAIFFVSFLRCSSEKTNGVTEAEVLFKEAEESIGKKRYIAALEKLNAIRAQHPYSFYATPSELRIADVKFLQENFAESAADYQLFRDMHPKHERIDYVIFRLAESLYNQMPSTFDRDLSVAEDSVKHYQELLDHYPKSLFLKDAKERIENVAKQVRSREKYIADFYFKTEKYEAALWRYEYILGRFNDVELIEHAKVRFISSLNELNRIDECLAKSKEFAPQLGQPKLQELSLLVEKCGKKIAKLESR